VERIDGSCWPKMTLPIVKCPDCNFEGEVEKDPCPIHNDCGEYAYICTKCGSLNVDYEARQRESKT